MKKRKIVAGLLSLAMGVSGSANVYADSNSGVYQIKAPVNVRKTPNKKYKPIGAYFPGRQIKIEKRVGNFYKLAGHSKYVHVDYAQKVSQSSKKSYSLMTSRGVNIRRGKGSNFAKIGYLKPGTKVYVENSSNSWLKLRDRAGYVHRSNFKELKTSVTRSTSGLRANSLYFNGNRISYIRSAVRKYYLHTPSGQATGHSSRVGIKSGSKVSSIWSNNTATIQREINGGVNKMVGPKFSLTDGISNAIIGHNPGSMAPIRRLANGSVFTVTDSNGKGYKYKVIERKQASKSNPGGGRTFSTLGMTSAQVVHNGVKGEYLMVQFCINGRNTYFLAKPI